MVGPDELALEDNLFDIIGVSPKATVAEIRRAFHKEARKLHPDMNPDQAPESSREFRRLVAAFETLSDPKRRMIWEQMRAARAWGGAMPRTPSWTSPWPGAGASNKEATPEADSSIFVQGGSLRTWSYRTSAVERVQVDLTTEGSFPIDADIELWHGPDQTPCEMRIYAENGQLRRFSAVIETPGPNTVAIRNFGMEGFPLMAKVLNADVSEPSAECLAAATTIEGDASRTFSFDLPVDSVQILLRTAGRPLNALIELIQGPSNTTKQVIELYIADGLGRGSPFFCTLETPGSGNTLRVVNTDPAKFPMSASVVPHAINQEIAEATTASGDADAAKALDNPLDRAAAAAAEAMSEETKARAADAEKIDRAIEMAARDADADEGDSRTVRGAAVFLAGLDAVAAQATAAAEAVAAKAAGDAETARAEAEVLRLEIEQATATAGAITEEMETRLQQAEEAREKARSVEAKRPPRDASERAERRRDAELKLQAEQKMAEFMGETKAGLQVSAAMHVELKEVAEAAAAGRQHMEARLQQSEKARQAEQDADAAKIERLKGCEAELLAEAAAIAARNESDAAMAAAEAAALRRRLGEETAEAEALGREIAQRQQLALQAQQTATRVEAENREVLRERFDSLQAELLTIVSMADGTDGPPGVDELSGSGHAAHAARGSGREDGASAWYSRPW